MENQIEGQLNAKERELLTNAIRSAARPPEVALEVGTWLGGGSTFHILDALEKNGTGHLWGVEADKGIYDRMIANIRQAVPHAMHRFTPLFGLSQQVLPKWLSEQKPGFQIHLAFLDGGNNPMEQIIEFRLIDPYMPVGSVLMAHDAKLRKGKWLVPYLGCLDHWESKLMDVSDEGLFYATKIADKPSSNSARKAQAALFKLRLAPAEIAAAVVPRSVCGAVLGLMPKKLARKLSDGRN